MNKNDVQINTKCKYKIWTSQWVLSKSKWRPKGVTYFARDPMRSYFDERQKNEIYFLNNII